MKNNTENTLGPTPTDLSEAIERIIDLAKKENAESVFEMSLDGFQANMHHAIGQTIRNEWGLWSQNSDLYKELSTRFYLTHADDLSGLILQAVYNTYHGKPLELEKTAASYHKHWAKMLEETKGVVRLSSEYFKN